MVTSLEKWLKAKVAIYHHFSLLWDHKHNKMYLISDYSLLET